MQTIVVADSDVDFLQWTAHQLGTGGTRVLRTVRSDEALKLFLAEGADILIADTHLQPFSGMELLAKARQRDPNAIVVLISAFGTTQAVIEAMKLGAFDFIRKEALPFNLKVVADAALKQRAELRAAASFRPQLAVEQHQDSIVGQSEAMQQVFKMIGRVADSEVPVMITGESGSGKELVARAIHHYSGRSEKSFVAINCAAIPEALLESELFGHEKGAFTGAVAQRMGRFEQSDGGTLFLDEIGEMPLAVQSKLLRVLQEGEFSRVGGSATLKADVRIVAATNRNLEDEIGRKLFREDLFYRLNVVRVHLPPLRQRVEDIRPLAEYFLTRIANSRRMPRLRLSEEAACALELYHWPGNVRELENTIQRACVLATTDVLLQKDIPLGVSAARADVPVESAGAFPEGADPMQNAVEVLLQAAQKQKNLQLLPWLEREFTIAAMKLTKGNQLQAAKLLGITRATLRKRIERFGITRKLSIE